MDGLVMNVPSSGSGGGGHTIEDEGTPLPAQTSLNFTGAGVTVTDAGGKTVVTISGGSGTFSITQATVILPFPANREHSVVVTDAAVTGTSKILVTLAGVPETQDNSVVDLLSLSAVPETGQFTLRATFNHPHAGPLVINYSLG